MKVLFAPDWRSGVPYQRLLAEALSGGGAEVQFLQGYKRMFPLTRLLAKQPCDILHLHWPEAYYPQRGDGLDWFRRARFAWDLRGATRQCALALTAHNLHAHNRADEPFAKRNTRAAHQRADVVFAHSEAAKTRLVEAFGVAPGKVVVIPHGDLSVTLGEPSAAVEARNALGLRVGKLALIFGAVEPYKGLEEVIAWWRQNQPDVTLALVGQPIAAEYGEKITEMIGGDPRITTRLEWLSDEQLRMWLSAADLAIFNYREIFTSGAANLARSWGLPILLPKRLDTVVLGEPTPSVHRFASFEVDFGAQLKAALASPPSYAAAAEWRMRCSWDRVAHLTMERYRRALQPTMAHTPLSPSP